MEVPGIECATSWFVVRHVDHSANEAVELNEFIHSFILNNESAFKLSTDKPIGKGPLGSPRRRLEDNIRMVLEEIGINTRNCVDSTQDRDY